VQLDDSMDISKDYIEKIIQLPIHLPELSAFDVENYLMLLVYEMHRGYKFQIIVDKVYRDENEWHAKIKEKALNWF